MPSGGNHPPRNAAPVSGPGALSRRTDGQPIRDLPNAKYGEGKEFVAAQQSAPLASAPQGAPPGIGIDPSGLVGLGAPSGMPDTPVTAGAPAGAGPGLEALGLPTASPKQSEAQALGKYLPQMIRIADSDDATPAFRQYVRELIANL